MTRTEGTTIYMTRGDSFFAYININKADGTPYTPVDGDKVLFAVKEKAGSNSELIRKFIPIDTLLFELKPADTAKLKEGTYLYDMKLIFADGAVDTFIDNAKLVLEERVGDGIL